MDRKGRLQFLKNKNQEEAKKSLERILITKIDETKSPFKSPNSYPKNNN